MPVADYRSFVLANTEIVSPPLIPEVALHLATEVVPLWQATEAELDQSGLPPPYWAFAWPGGQGLARYILDRPSIVAGRSVLDFAAGCGLAGISSAMCQGNAVANDIDRFATAAIRLNADLNGVTVAMLETDLLSDESSGAAEVVLAGDICYERPLAQRVEAWLRARADEGALVLLGDPGRNYLPQHGLEFCAEYDVPTSLELEDRQLRRVVVWRVLP